MMDGETTTGNEHAAAREQPPTGDRVAELEAELAAYKAKEAKENAERQHAEWVKQVSEETGVPANALRGNTIEELQEHAAILRPLVHPAPKLPNVPNPGQHPTTNHLPRQLNIMADLHRVNYGD